MKPSTKLMVLAPLALLAMGAVAGKAQREASGTRVPVVFSGGHETDRRDHGRPVVLVAGALGVPPQVFRDAFSHVRPAPAGMAPEPGQVHDNKRALLDALGPYGVTNERLDEVSDHYRYVRSRGELWPVEEATAYALVKDGKITKFVVTNGGSGYTSSPTITVPSIPGAAGKAKLSFSEDFDKNGAVASIAVATTAKENQNLETP